MKRTNLLATLCLTALLAGLATACTRDDGPTVVGQPRNTVTLRAGIDPAAITARGATPAASGTRAATAVTVPDGYKLRYILEVTEGNDPNAFLYREEKTSTDGSGVDFTFTLAETGDYGVRFWADFVRADATMVDGELNGTKSVRFGHYPDVYYYTTESAAGLSEVRLNTGSGAPAYAVNDEARDAFYACTTITKGAAAFTEEVTLSRPFGQINLIEKDATLLDKVESVTIAYDMPRSFDVRTGMPSDILAVTATVRTLPAATAQRKANLVFDYVFAPAEGQTTLGEITLSFTSKDKTLVIQDVMIPANIPVVQNKRTNVRGRLISTAAAPSDQVNFSVSVSPDWDTPDEEQEVTGLPEKFYVRGSHVGWNVKDAISYIPVTGVPGKFWRMQYLTKGEEFKFFDDLDFTFTFGVPEGSAPLTGDPAQVLPFAASGNWNIEFDGPSGWYILAVTLNDASRTGLVTGTLQLCPPEVYITGALQPGGLGDTSSAPRFTAPIDKTGSFTCTVPATYLTGEPLRIFARLPEDVEWWRSELLPYNGKIEYRGNRDELSTLGMSVNVNLYDTILLGFGDDSASIASASN